MVNWCEWETTNTGTGFVVTKIKIPKNELRNYFPSLQNVIETKDERDWYPRLPNVSNNLFIHQIKHFILSVILMDLEMELNQPVE